MRSDCFFFSYFLNEKKGWGLEMAEMKRALAEARAKGASNCLIGHVSPLSWVLTLHSCPGYILTFPQASTSGPWSSSTQETPQVFI